MEKKLTVDRVEEGTAVLFDEAGREYRAELAYKEGTILLCGVEGDSLTVLCTLDEEAERKTASSASRLKALFLRGDNK